MSTRSAPLAAVLVVAAVAAVSGASASASVFTLSLVKCTGGSILNGCYENLAKEKLELEGEQTAVGKNKGSAIIKVKEIEAVAECKTGKSSGVVTQKAPLTETGVASGTITFEECALTAESSKALFEKCAIPATITTRSLTSKLISESEVEIVPTSGTVFLEASVTNKGAEACPSTFRGLHSLTGKDKVKIVNPGTAEVTKEGENIAKSGLETGSESVELTGHVITEYTGLEDKVYVSKEA